MPTPCTPRTLARWTWRVADGADFRQALRKPLLQRRTMARWMRTRYVGRFMNDRSLAFVQRTGANARHKGILVSAGTGVGQALDEQRVVPPLPPPCPSRHRVAGGTRSAPGRRKADSSAHASFRARQPKHLLEVNAAHIECHSAVAVSFGRKRAGRVAPATQKCGMHDMATTMP